MNSVERGMYRSIIMTGRARTAGKSKEVSRPKGKVLCADFSENAAIRMKRISSCPYKKKLQRTLENIQC